MRKSVIPVILVAVIAALCLSLAFAGNADHDGEKEAYSQFGNTVTFYTVTGTVLINSAPLESATVVLSSDSMTVNGTTGPTGSFSLAIVPGTYNLTISKIGYVTHTEEITVETSDVNVPAISMSAKTADNGSTITGYVIAVDDFARYSDSNVEIKLYYRTTSEASSKISDYATMQFTNTIDVANGTFTIKNVKYDGAAGKDTLVDRCYIGFSISTYSVANVSASCITDKIVFTDDEGVRTTLYHLNKDISSTGSFEDNASYSLGSSISACTIFEPAKGTISGSMNTSGTVTITDSEGTVFGQGAADSNGLYSFSSYVGENLTITYTSVGYKNKPFTITVYDDNIDPQKNKQAAVTLEKLDAGKTYIHMYIDGKTSRIDDESIQKKFTLYYLMNPEEIDPSKRVYEAKATTNVLTTDMKDGKVNGYYFTFEIAGNLECARCFLNVDISGYSVRSVQTEFMELTTTLINADQISTNGLKKACSTTGYFEVAKEYSVGSCSADSILIDSATGTITGDVYTNTDNSSALNGVKVSIINKDDNTIVAYGITYNKGNYSIKVATGDYKIKYEIEGYVTYEGTVKVYDDAIYDPSKNAQPTVKLDAEKGDWFGMDLPHALLVIGGIIAVILIFAVLFHRFRILDKKNKVIYEDEDEEERK